MNIKAQNYGLGIRMIGQMVRTFIITMAGGMATWRPTLRYQKKKYILPYRISMTRESIK
jgi:hypothetical protein